MEYTPPPFFADMSDKNVIEREVAGQYENCSCFTSGKGGCTVPGV